MLMMVFSFGRTTKSRGMKHRRLTADSHLCCQETDHFGSVSQQNSINCPASVTLKKLDVDQWNCQKYKCIFWSSWLFGLTKRKAKYPKYCASITHRLSPYSWLEQQQQFVFHVQKHYNYKVFWWNLKSLQTEIGIYM